MGQAHSQLHELEVNTTLQIQNIEKTARSYANRLCSIEQKLPKLAELESRIHKLEDQIALVTAMEERIKKLEVDLQQKDKNQNSLVKVETVDDSIVPKDQTPKVQSTKSSKKKAVLVLSASYDSTVRLYNLKKQKCIAVCEDHTDKIHCVVAIDDVRNASAGYDNKIKIWNTETNEIEHTFTGHTGWITCLIKFDEDRIISGSADTTIKVWNIKSSERVLNLDKQKYSISSLAKIDKNRFVSGCNSNIQIWNIETGECLQIIAIDAYYSVVSLAVIQSSYIIAADSKNVLSIWSIAEKKYLYTLTTHSSKINCIIPLLPFNSNRFATCSDDYTIKIWNIESRECEFTLRNQTIVYCIAAVNENTIISGDNRGKVCVWDLTKRECIHVFADHSDRIYSVAVQQY